MELETSRAMMISTPVRFNSFTLAPVWGLDNPSTKKNNPKENKTIFNQPRLRDTSGIRGFISSGSPNFFTIRLPYLLYIPYTKNSNGMKANIHKYCA